MTRLTPSSRRGRARTAAVLVCSAALAAGCSTGAQAARKARPRPAPTTTDVPVMPLTGLPVTNPATAARPAVSVKVGNSSEAWPQSGLQHADVVYEEVIEGGITRYLAVFQSQDADPVGPVRSVRQTDAQILAPIGGLLGYSGGIASFVSDVRAAGIVDASAVDDGAAYYRSPQRQAPHNLYTSTEVLRQRTPSGAGAPQQLFSYVASGQSSQPAGARPAGSVVVAMTAATSATWRWSASGGKWLRSTNGVAQTDSTGAPLAFTNVIVMEVPYHDTGFVDPAGAPVPDADLVGTGQAWVLTAGSLARATWSKPAPSSVVSYTASNGEPLRLARGSTWVMLAPQGAAVTAAPAGTG